MGLHPNFPTSLYEILEPSIRWFPADEQDRDYLFQKLIPPLVAGVRVAVKEWRDRGYEGASETSKALLKWWFQTPHPTEASGGEVFDFRYYFAQREAVESVIYLYEVATAREPFDLIRNFDATGELKKSLFPESWSRYVVKMATGSGKTKVLSLLIAWSYFHKKYEDASPLSRNILLIAPNIIVLERLLADFGNLRIFSTDPILPPNGFADRQWGDDFQMTLHVQDDIGRISPSGN